MFIKNLELTNFRNYESCKIDFTTDKTILVGKNAQGKTNLLEAIYYLAALSSFKAGHDFELIQKGKDFSFLKAEIVKHETEIKLEALINPPKTKVLKVNGLKKTKYSQFLGSLIVVNFGISDLLLLRGTPSDRRKWLDDAISQLYPAYKDRLAKYNKIRTQRNNLLKDFRGNTNLGLTQKNSLEVWNEQIAIAGSNIIHLRQKYLKEIQKISNEKHKIISQSNENLLIKYNSSILGSFNAETDDLLTPEKIAEIYHDQFKQKINEEIIRAQTLIGPHRDDIVFCINDMDAVSYASQGQQRTVVLALKLAELDFIQNIIKETPVLLLDDVLAELDQSRQNYLLDSIKGNIQTIITTVDISNFEPFNLKGVTVYNIDSGKIYK